MRFIVELMIPNPVVTSSYLESRQLLFVLFSKKKNIESFESG